MFAIMEDPLGRFVLLERSQLDFCHQIPDAQAVAVLSLPEDIQPGPESALLCKALLEEARQVTRGKAHLCPAIYAGDCVMEPYGELPFAQAVARYHELAVQLAQSGAQCVMIHRAKSMLQARAGVLGARASGLPVLVSMEPIGEGESLLGQTDLLSAFAVLQQLGVAAFGYATSVAALQQEALALIQPHSRIPVFSITHNLTGGLSAQDTGELFARRAAHFSALGVSGIGIWGAGLEQLAQAVAAVSVADRQETASIDQLDTHDLWAANETQVYYLDENVEYSQPVDCRLDMTDDILEMEKEICDLLCIRVDSQDEAHAISMNNGHMDQMPVSLLSDDEAALEAALFYYNGRAVIDSRSVLPEEILQRLARQYGGVII